MRLVKVSFTAYCEEVALFHFMHDTDLNPSNATVAPKLVAVWLALAFLLTGAATALLGAVLPVLLKQWGMDDRSGGNLLLLAWGGSTCGALFCRGRLRGVAAGGLLMTAAAMVGVAVLDRQTALPLFAFYGIGLGMAMTAITMLCSRQESATDRNSTLMRLNLLWSIGSCVSPTLTTHALTLTHAGGLFMSMGIVFGVVACAVWMCGKGSRAAFRPEEQAIERSRRSAPLALFAMAALAVGVESAIGGWLTTYAGRTTHTEVMAISATSAFWAGLLISRAMHSVPSWRWLHTGGAMVVHAAITAVAAATLLAAPHTGFFLPSALLTGFGLGPLYPRVLSMVVGTYQPRAIFIVAGVGSAALPWMTGLVSHAQHSLRSGLILPFAGSVMLLGLMLPMWRPSRSMDATN
jgi:FHS family glucose/mannose:H+ symporter-like MFS transporter